jgi:hypothetical protein
MQTTTDTLPKYERVALTREEIERFQLVLASLSTNLSPGRFYEILELNPNYYHSHAMYDRFLAIGHGLQVIDTDTLVRLANAYSSREV